MRAQAARIERALAELARALGEVAVASVAIADEAALAAAPGFPGLLGEEARIYARHRSPRRRAEFLAGRRAARRAAALALGGPSLGGPGDAALEIGEDALGAPAVRGHPGLRVSISHSHAVAVAIAAPFAIGVDLELDEPRPEALARFFFTAAERGRMAAAPAPERQALVSELWTRKEAAAKVGRWGGRLPFGSLDCSGETVTVRGRRIALRSARAAGYALSVARELGEG